jgi:RNA polymerase sigma-70 factor, ECF subfamily
MSSLGYNDGRGANAARSAHAKPDGDGAGSVPPPGKIDRRADRGADRAGNRGDDTALENAHAALTAHAMASDQRTDEQLLNGYQQGDKAAFATLVSRYQRELFHFLIRFIGDRAAAEDVFQESFLQVHQSAAQFDTSRRFRPWLFTIAANKARDLIRSNARRPTNPLSAAISPGDDDSGEFIDLMQSTQEFPDDPIQRQELQDSVKNTVMSMPENLREILLLSYFHQFPYKQISDILDIPLGTVKSRLHAAVAFFADRWKQLNQSKTAS